MLCRDVRDVRGMFVACLVMFVECAWNASCIMNVRDVNALIVIMNVMIVNVHEIFVIARVNECDGILRDFSLV